MSERRTSVTGDAAQLPTLTRVLQQFWCEARLPPAHELNFELALEEVFLNIVMHASLPGRGAQVEVSLALAGDGLTMTVEDDGPRFDPLSLPPPDVSAGLNERPVGGLGVFLVRRVMDTVSYQHVAGRNRLSMMKSLSS